MRAFDVRYANNNSAKARPRWRSELGQSLHFDGRPATSDFTSTPDLSLHRVPSSNAANSSPSMRTLASALLYLRRTRCGLCQEYAEVSLPHLELTDWRSDLGGREDRRRHLVEQRLKYVVVAPVDQDDLGFRVPQGVRRRKPGKAAADDHDTPALQTWRLHDRRCLIRPSVGQHRAHGPPCSCPLSFMASANSLPVQCS
jgi:hypothetical protein